MANILAQIANPRTADISGAVTGGQRAAQQHQIGAQQLNLLQQQVSEGQVQQQRSEVAKGILAAYSTGPGANRNAILNDILSKTNDVPTKEAVSGLLAAPEGEESEAQFVKAIDYFRQAGYLPKVTAAAAKSPEQLARETALKERGLDIEEQKLGIRAREVEKTVPGAISSLGKLIKERDALDPNNTKDRAAYDARIDALTAKRGSTVINSQAQNLAKQVVEGRLDPNKISKRGGLQQTVFSLIEELYPGTNLVELEANARFKNTAANLQSRALINGVQPLYDSLLAAGETLHNTKYPLINKAVNFAKEQTGDPDVVAFNNLRDDVIAETERILLGSGVLSDTKYIRALKNVNTAQSYPQLKAAIAQLELVVETRLEALDKQPFRKASAKTETETKTEAKEAAGKIKFLGFE